MIKAIGLALTLFATSALAADMTDKVMLSEVHVSNKAFFPAVEGVAKNNTGVTLENLFITFKLYNDAGEVVGSALARGKDVEPGESWRFSTPTTIKFTKAKLSKIEIY
jgi:hypothetical protein